LTSGWITVDIGRWRHQGKHWGSEYRLYPKTYICKGEC